MHIWVRTLLLTLAFLLHLPETACPVAAPEGVSLSVVPGKETAYPGEKIPVLVTLRAEGATVRNIGYPRLAGDLPCPEFGRPQQSQEGNTAPSAVTTYSFISSITPTRPGRIVVGPATLQCELVEADEGRASFFGEVVAHPVTVTSPAVPLTVLPFPPKGRPAGFGGAVGRFTVTRTARPAAVNIGDPVTVETTVRGDGNLADIACPPASASNLNSYPPRRLLSKARLACEEVVVPHSLPASIPAATIVSFDPQSREYRTATAAAVPLHPLQPLPPPRLTPLPPRQAAGQPAAAPDRWKTPPLYAALAVAFPCAAVGLLTVYRRFRPTEEAAACRDHHTEGDCFITVAERALAEGDSYSFYTAMFRGVQIHLAERLDVPAETVASTSPEDGAASRILARCDLVRYGNQVPDQAEMTHDLRLFRDLLRPTPNLSPHQRRNP